MVGFFCFAWIIGLCYEREYINNFNFIKEIAFYVRAL